jgi:ABC-type multidrug transport system fused ATPase/permease subunit
MFILLYIWHSPSFFLKDILTELEHRPTLDTKLNICGNIRFDNVSFAYPSRPSTMILSDLTFEVQCGQTIAIIGSNGSGKVKHHFFSRLFCNNIVWVLE